MPYLAKVTNMEVVKSTESLTRVCVSLCSDFPRFWNAIQNTFKEILKYLHKLYKVIDTSVTSQDQCFPLSNKVLMWLETKQNV